MLKRTGIAVMASLVLSGCQTAEIQTEAVGQSLQPVERRTPVVGDVWRYRQDGKQMFDEVIAVDAGDVTLRSSDGCTWTEATRFSPSTRWHDCAAFADGTQNLSGDDELFPVRLGASAEWEVQGSDAKGNQWQTTRRCTVAETARVTVPAGTFDTYRVQCVDRWSKRDWFFAPVVGAVVLFQRTPKGRGEIVRREMVGWRSLPVEAFARSGHVARRGPDGPAP